MMNEPTLENLKAVLLEYLQGNVRRKDVFDWAMAVCKGQVTYSEANPHTVFQSILNICEKDPDGEFLIRESDIQQYSELLEKEETEKSKYTQQDCVLSTIKPLEQFNSGIHLKTLRYWLSGIGIMEDGKFTTVAGNEYLAERMYPENSGFDIYKPSKMEWIEAAEDLLKTLNCSWSDIQNLNETVDKSSLPRYKVMRLDDNGNEYLIQTYDLYGEANKRLAEFEKLHHKQTYWIDEVQK